MADFHFIRPLWLITFLALPLILWLIQRISIKSSGWQKLIPSHLNKGMVNSKQSTKQSLLLPLLIISITSIALAGPTWKKLPQPVYQVAKGSVMIMDMSYSMYATDLKPNRLTQSRFKATDLLNKIEDGEVGLIAYAGDAFTISPLTDDTENIKLLLPSLSPDLMPELGSNPYAALVLAADMLKNAGHIKGDIYWFTDGVEHTDLEDLNQWNKEHDYQVNIISVGTKEGAPITLTNGELMKDRFGSIIIPKVEGDILRGVAMRGGGKYSPLFSNDDDLDYILTSTKTFDEKKKESSNKEGDQWQDFGPYLVLLLLPMALFYFRRGSLLVILPCFLLLPVAKPTYADLWSDLWKTKDQQGQALYNKEAYKDAAEQFNDPMWQGNAHYKAGNYEKALTAYNKANTAQGLYNQGNALAKLQKLDEAIEAYKKSLSLDPSNEDAKTNKTIVEQLKEAQDKQNQQNQDQQNQDQQNQEQQNQDPQNQEQQNQEQQNQEQQNQEQQNQEQQNQDQQNQEQQNQEQQNQEQQNQEQQNQDQQNQEQQNQEQQNQEQQNQEQQNQEQQEVDAQIKEQADKEAEQKYQQILNKVTDDPYLLLRNKMQLEYQKRRQNRSDLGDKKKW